jgi:transcriptional regulator GlxA family with amidase domain
MRTFVTAISGAAALNTVSVLDPLIMADAAWRSLREPTASDLFLASIVGIDESPIEFASGVQARPGVIAGSGEPPELVLVPGLAEDVLPSLERNRHWVPWLERWHAQGATIASSCTGAFLLAESGLLDGRRATTHWMAAPLFSASFPNVILGADRVIVDEGDVITSGGSTTAFNLVHYLVSRFGSPERAAAATRMMLIDSGRDSQLPFAEVGLHRGHRDPVVHIAQSLIQQSVVNELTVAHLAKAVGVSTRTLGRHFADAIGHSPKAYIDAVRIEAAKRSLEQTSVSIAEVRLQTAFTDPTAFRRAFKRSVGVTPTEYRRRFGNHQMSRNVSPDTPTTLA